MNISKSGNEDGLRQTYQGSDGNVNDGSGAALSGVL